MKALYPISWTAAQKELCYAPVPHTQTTADGKFSCLTIDPDYKAKWKAQFATMQPLIKAQALLGVFLGDEHMYFGVKVSEVKLIVDLIREDWPSAIIYENEAPDVAMCNYRKDNTTIWEDGECMPSNLDWFGFDFYAHDSSVWSGPREAYTTMVYPRFGRPDQKVCGIPLASVDLHLGVDARISCCHLNHHLRCTLVSTGCAGDAGLRRGQPQVSLSLSLSLCVCLCVCVCVCVCVRACACMRACVRVCVRL